jgi:hypothetical protein
MSVPDFYEINTLWFLTPEHMAACPRPPGRLSDLSTLSVFHSKLFLYGGFVWARMALNNQKRRFPARAVGPEKLGAQVRELGSYKTHSPHLS